MRTILKTLLFMLLSLNLTLPVQALVPMNEDTIKHAILYGLSMQGRTYRQLFGPNWKENTRDGSLVNVYTPYMTLAAKAYSVKGLSRRLPLDEAYKQAKPRLQREIVYLKDTRTPKKIKFTASLLGTGESFPDTWHAEITGFRNGTAFRLTPTKTVRGKATPLPSGRRDKMEAILGFYFPYAQVAKLQGDFQFTLLNKAASGEITERQVFQFTTEELY